MLKNTFVYKVKRRLWHSITSRYRNFVKNHDWDIFRWEKAKIYYEERTGLRLNYKKPADINEKLMWLTRYWRHPLKTKCADKYLVREYVKECGLGHLLIPLLGVYRDASEIRFEELPEQFVLKCNHGSGFNVICVDKQRLDVDKTRTQLTTWLNIDFSKLYHEIHYHDIPRRIICEPLISNTAPIEYQMWCINGEIESLLVCRKNFNGTYDAWSYSKEWIHLCDRIGESEENELDCPQQLTNLLEYASILAKPFPFVRADFYEVKGRVYFAELTFTPAANVLSAYKPEFIKRLGDKLVLPQPLL